MERYYVSKALAKDESPSSSSVVNNNIKQQACLKWADSLHNLLKDTDGVKLFLEYLENEGTQYADCLHFWFACEGLKNHNDFEKIQKLIKLIYKTYFMKSALPIDDELRKEIRKKIKLRKQEQCLDTTLFDEAQLQIETLINNTTYPNFLKSDLYLKYLRSASSESSSSSSPSVISNRDFSNLASGIGPLPTLHEDTEFTINQPLHLLTTPGTGSVSTGYQTPLSGPIRLTKDVLLMSQKHRALEIRPKTETFAGSLYRSGSAIHSAYNSYNPVSRQDSDKQSVSSHSDARTESDNLSFIDPYDGRMSGRPQSRHKITSSSSNDGKNILELALKNKEDDSIFFIPRTLRLMDIRKRMPLDLQEHAQVLKQKLENIKRQQDEKELLNKKLKDSNDSLNSFSNEPKCKMSEIQSRELENAIKEKMGQQVDYLGGGDDQNILDEHISRTIPDSTLAMSPPGMGSLRLLSSLSRTRRAPEGCSSYNVSELQSCINKHRKVGFDARSNSLERNQPKQPFLVDPNIPLPACPNTTVQLEEARRRLMEDDLRTKSKQRSKCGGELASQSGTFRKTLKQQDITIAVVSFHDEEFPYRVKIPGRQISLKQFKENLPKKGNYRFFFKTVSEDVDNQVAHEEVGNDWEIVPLWEGKIMAQLKPID